MTYKINYEDNRDVQIQLNNVKFTIKKETGMLYDLSNNGMPTDVVIPYTFPSGHQIQCLGSSVVKGIFNTITISDHILIGPNAFKYAKVKKVIWNDCPCIPTHCFDSSDIEEIFNIDNVKGIHSFAFMFSKIEQIVWPKHCSVIPTSCFYCCGHLKEVIAPHIVKIKSAAFSNSSITSFDWPKECRNIPMNCFDGSELSEINNLSEIETIGKYAFRDTKLSILDLSSAGNIYLTPSSLKGLPKSCKLIPPYYIDNEELSIAMDDKKQIFSIS